MKTDAGNGRTAIGMKKELRMETIRENDQFRHLRAVEEDMQ